MTLDSVISDQLILIGIYSAATIWENSQIELCDYTHFTILMTWK
ncbi:hypothetical protein Pan54_25130 [Rubinisphaera italica]|uniref:Uncharacterized protein n=1 Tax=Rubinisphaera italica TaxID=2527969 RepID=A0A5C5XFA2_9PLAN|nr:hypothetical protein Pan54_25130 [Rubinisphaera italica]